MRSLLAVSLAIVACRGPAKPGPLPTADEMVGHFVPLRFGAELGELRGARPALQASGWQEGERATWLDPTFEAGLEAELQAGRLVGVRLTFGPGRAEAPEQALRARLGRGVECAAVAEAGDFRPVLWRTADGGSVNLLRKRRVLQVHIQKPAPPTFDAAWQACAAPP